MTPRSRVFNLLQTHLDEIGCELRKIRDRLERLPMPEPVPFPKPHIDHETQSKRLYCNFCGKSQDEVDQLIAGPTIFICDECVELCQRIVEEKRAKES